MKKTMSQNVDMVTKPKSAEKLYFVQFGQVR